MQSSANRYSAIGYSVPASPSRLRVYIWRKLRQIGAENLRPGLAVLPENNNNQEELSSLARLVGEMGGEASVYTLMFTDPAEERGVIRQFAQRAMHTLGELEEELKAAAPGKSRRLVSRVRKTIADYEKLGAPHDPSVREEFEEALRSVLSAIKSLPGALSGELRDLLK